MGPTSNRHTTKAHPVQVRCLSSPERGELWVNNFPVPKARLSRIQCKFHCSCGICRKLNTKRFLFSECALGVMCPPNSRSDGELQTGRGTVPSPSLPSQISSLPQTVPILVCIGGSRPVSVKVIIDHCFLISGS